MSNIRYYYCEKCKKHFTVTEEEIKENGLECTLNKCLKNMLVYLGNENSTEESKKKRYDEFVVNKKGDYIGNAELDAEENIYSRSSRGAVKQDYSNFGE